MKNKISIYHILIIAMLVVVNVYSLPMMVTLVGNVILLLISGGLFVNASRIKENNGVFIVLSILSFYTLMVCLSAFEVSSYTIGKPIRMLVVYVLFSLMSSRLAKYTYNEIAAGLVAGLSVHLTCVYIQFFVPTTKLFFFNLLENYEKETIAERSLRAFGLCASFDSAGLCICVMMVLLWILFKKSHNILLFLLSIVALVACFMIGRTAMLVGSVFFVMMLFNMFRNNKRYFIISTILSVIAVFYAWGIAQELLNASILEESYRKESLDYLTDDMLFLPDSIGGIIFGTGMLPQGSDIGYVKIIHMVGLVGLAMVLYMYFLTIKNIKKYRKSNTSVYSFMLLLLLLLLIYNYKLLLLYASGMNDLYFLLYFVFVRKLRPQQQSHRLYIK